MEKLIKQYYDIFPNTHFFPTWFDIPDKDKIKILKEAINKKIRVTETQLYLMYEEKIVY